jgi:hypothetical protein
MEEYLAIRYFIQELRRMAIAVQTSRDVRLLRNC